MAAIPQANLANNASDASESQEFRLLQPFWDLRLGREHLVGHPLFPIILSVGFYWLGNVPFMISDLYKIGFMQKYKMQSDREVTWPQMRKAMKKTAYNNIVWILPIAIAQSIWQPGTPLPAQAPSMMEFFGGSWLLLILFDFQYWLWHACHHKNRWLYKNFHAIHHQYHSTFSWTTQYLHPWELFTVGFFATIDPWFFDCHPMTGWAFILLNVAVSIEAHCGYDLPFLMHKWMPFYGGGPKHDMHHLRPLTNFQPFFRTFDKLFGWDCPEILAGNVKSKRLEDWEKDRAGERLHKLAFELMGGSENGELMPDKDKPRDAAASVHKNVGDNGHPQSAEKKTQ